jgi:hypothetical protein
MAPVDKDLASEVIKKNMVRLRPSRPNAKERGSPARYRGAPRASGSAVPRARRPDKTARAFETTHLVFILFSAE